MSFGIDYWKETEAKLYVLIVPLSPKRRLIGRQEKIGQRMKIGEQMKIGLI